MIKVIHTYDVEHRWTIEYEATSNEDTLFNPTNHVYFNLNRDNNVIDNHSIISEQLKMYPIDQNHLISSQQPIDLLERFNHRPIQFQDILILKINKLKNKYILIKVSITHLILVIIVLSLKITSLR